MSIFDGWFDWWPWAGKHRPARNELVTVRGEEGGSTRAISSARPPRAAGRVTLEHPGDELLSAVSFIAPLSHDDQLRGRRLDLKTLERMPPARLLELLADSSPDVSRELWNFLRMCNPGYTYKCFRPGTETEDKAAKGALDEFLRQLHGPYAAPNVVPFDVLIGALFLGMFLRGACLAELVCDRDGREPLEIATPDPSIVGFRRVRDEDRGAVWQLGQWQAGKFVAFDRPTVIYVPVDPFPGRPAGRAMAAPAVFTTLFLLGMLHDLKRVISQQGYPRTDITVKLAELVKAMPEEDREDPAAVEAWVKRAVDEITEFVGRLEPDEAYVHLDYIEMGKQPVGAGDRNSLGGIGDLIKALERMAVRALKTLPLLMGINEATSETHANRQWEIYAAGVKSIQHYAEFVLEHVLTLALQVKGVAARVEFRFAELRAAELLRDAQAETVMIANEARKRDEGWQTNDEAANKIVGHAAVAPPAAPRAGSDNPAGAGQINADPGSQRAKDSAPRDRQPAAGPPKSPPE
jgi:hypothetical protein